MGHGPGTRQLYTYHTKTLEHLILASHLTLELYSLQGRAAVGSR